MTGLSNTEGFGNLNLSLVSQTLLQLGDPTRPFANLFNASSAALIFLAAAFDFVRRPNWPNRLLSQWMYCFVTPIFRQFRRTSCPYHGVDPQCRDIFSGISVRSLTPLQCPSRCFTFELFSGRVRSQRASEIWIRGLERTRRDGKGEGSGHKTLNRPRRRNCPACYLPVSKLGVHSQFLRQQPIGSVDRSFHSQSQVV